MAFNTPPDQRTTSQKVMQAHRIMERAIFEEAYGIVSMCATDISHYLTVLERDTWKDDTN